MAYEILVYAGIALGIFLLGGIIIFGVLLIVASIATGLVALVGSIALRRWWKPPWTDELTGMIDDFS